MSSADGMGKFGQYVLAILKRSWPDYATIICLGLLLMVFRENVDGNRRPFTPVSCFSLPDGCCCASVKGADALMLNKTYDFIFITFLKA